jgi:Bacterial protein of unknown function (DUF937)
LTFATLKKCELVTTRQFEIFVLRKDITMNLLEMVQAQLTPGVLGQLGSAVGLNPADTGKAMSAIVPAQLGALIQQGSSVEGAGNLLGMASKFLNFGNLGGLLGQANGVQSATQAGASLLPSLFGNQLGGVVQAVAQHTGLGSGPIEGLMKLGAPMIMGVLGGHAAKEGLNPAGLVSMLGGLAGPVSKMLPGNLGSLLGGLGGAAGLLGGAGAAATGALGAMGTAATGAASSAASTATRAVGGVAATAAATTAAATGQARGGMGWLLPVLGVAALGGLGWFFLGRGTPAITATDTTTPATSTPDTSSSGSTSSDMSSSGGTSGGDAMMAKCDKEFSLGVKEGDTVTQPFRFGGSGKGAAYIVTIKREDGRTIGSKTLNLDANCDWGWDSKPGLGKVIYEVTQEGDSVPVATLNLTVN